MLCQLKHVVHAMWNWLYVATVIHKQAKLEGLKFMLVF